MPNARASCRVLEWLAPLWAVQTFSMLGPQGMAGLDLMLGESLG